MIPEAGLAAVVFAATDVDDLLILAAFFAQRRIRPAAIVAGQYLGIAALFAVSALAAWLALGVPKQWVALLGLAPLLMGVWALRSMGKEDDPLPGSLPEAGGSGGVLMVATVTVANGGDNLGVYIPLFATHADALAVFAGVFIVGTAVWCWLAHFSVNHGRVGALLSRYAHVALPFVLIALGAWILYRGFA